jgi:hypothetical protein
LSKTGRPKIWLYSHLPEDVPEFRILYGYRSDFFIQKNHLRNDLRVQAEILDAHLLKIRHRGVRDLTKSLVGADADQHEAEEINK